MEKKIHAPLVSEEIKELRAGDYVYITGTVYTARDAAHKRMEEALNQGSPLPLDLKDNVIYYMGPSPARQGRPIGSAGPTTASRMDKYAPRLLDLGLKGMIGKGKTDTGSGGGHCEKSGSVFCRCGRRRRAAFQVYRGIPGDCL